MPIKTHKRPVKGWTIQDMIFPKGMVPRKARWRIKPAEGLHQRYIDKVLENETQKNRVESAISEIESIEELPDGGYRLIGWTTMSESSYLYDSEDALRD